MAHRRGGWRLAAWAVGPRCCSLKIWALILQIPHVATPLAPEDPCIPLNRLPNLRPLLLCPQEEEEKAAEQQRQRAALAAEKAAALPPEPPADSTEPLLTCLLRFPDGSRHSRRFRRAEPLQASRAGCAVLCCAVLRCAVPATGAGATSSAWLSLLPIGVYSIKHNVRPGRARRSCLTLWTRKVQAGWLLGSTASSRSTRAGCSRRNRRSRHWGSWGCRGLKKCSSWSLCASEPPAPAPAGGRPHGRGTLLSGAAQGKAAVRPPLL